MKNKITLLLFFAAFLGFAQVNNFYSTQSNGRWLQPAGDITLETFLENSNSVLGLSQENSLVVLQKSNDDIGMTHTRYAQYYKGVLVEGAQVLVHEKNGFITSVNGSWVKDISGSETPNISVENALTFAKAQMPADKYYWEIPEMEKMLKEAKDNPNATYFPKAKLVFANQSYSPNGAQYKLSFKLDIYADTEENHKTIFIDATTGDLNYLLEGCHEGNANGVAETRYSGTQNIITDSVSPTEFRLYDNTRGGSIHVLNTNNTFNFGSAVEFTDSNNYWNNTNAQMNDAATDAYWGLQMSYDYFMQQHNRDSYDDSGSAILAYVHVGTNWFNASWNGQFIRFGDGSGNPLTHIDVAAHELGHGVTGTSAGLIYAYESGALNESYSDIFGNSVEFFSQSTGADWLIGTANFALRDMSDPKSYGDPDTYLGQNWEFGAVDNGGVHTNSGVQNHWFYLLSDGGTGTNDNNDNYAVGALGIDTAGAIAYRNLVYYLTPSSNYYDAREGAILSALDLYGQCSNQVLQTIKAWHAVGVGPDNFSDDFAVLDASELNSGCGLSSTETLGMSVVYYPPGCTSKITTGDSIYYSYTINGATVKEGVAINAAPQPGDTLTHLFSNKADFSQIGTYSIDFKVKYVHDLVTYNDRITGIEISNTLPLSDTANVVDFEKISEMETFTFTKTGIQGSVERRPFVAGNNSLFGLRITSTSVSQANIDFPVDETENFTKNPQYAGTICTCVDAVNWTNVSLKFDVKQTYSEMYKQFFGQDLPQFATSLRVTVNDNPESVQLHPTTYKSDPYYTHTLNLDKYAGKLFTLCFEGKHFIPLKDEQVPGSPGDNTYLDNIILENKFVISVEEEALPELKIYPNPSNGLVFIEFKNIEGTVTVVNQLGQTIKTAEVDYTNTLLEIDLSKQKAGVYFIHVKSTGQNFVEKVVIY